MPEIRIQLLPEAQGKKEKGLGFWVSVTFLKLHASPELSFWGFLYCENTKDFISLNCSWCTVLVVWESIPKKVEKSAFLKCQ